MEALCTRAHTHTRLGLKEITLDVSFSSYRLISANEILGLSVLCEKRQERRNVLYPDLSAKFSSALQNPCSPIPELPTPCFANFPHP